MDTDESLSRLTGVLALEVVNPSDLETSARAGDAAAFGELIRAWDHDLRGVVWTVVRSADATDDVMQNSYEKAFRAIGRFDGRASLKTWLHTVCLRSAIDYTRREAHRKHDDLTHVVASPAAQDVADGAVASVELGRVFDSLEPVEQVLLMLTAGLGYSFDETATIVGLPRGTVASKVGRARVELRNRREQ